MKSYSLVFVCLVLWGCNYTAQPDSNSEIQALRAAVSSLKSELIDTRTDLNEEVIHRKYDLKRLHVFLPKEQTLDCKSGNFGAVLSGIGTCSYFATMPKHIWMDTNWH